MPLLARVLPRSMRLAASRRLAVVDESRVERELAAAARGAGPVVAGPWLGEVGFELLYWVPFLAWFAERFAVEPPRFTVLSRGGTASWYRPFARQYRDVLDHMTPEEFRARHDARVRELGEQKQTRPTAADVELAARMAGVPLSSGSLLHPSSMYRLMRRFWWGHLGTEWVHRHTRYRRHVPPERAAALPPSYTAVKFYFNECFPATDANRAFVRQTLERLAADGPVVSLSAGVTLDDHSGCHVPVPGVLELEGSPQASRNLDLQASVVAHARRFVGTYGGFAYLAPFYGVASVGYYSNPAGFARSHLDMAYSAFETIGSSGLLHVAQTPRAPVVN